tara:strand:+ start:99 stop:596 length:498 start_codon:yes stop_codon:yes gene_type:complete
MPHEPGHTLGVGNQVGNQVGTQQGTGGTGGTGGLIVNPGEQLPDPQPQPTPRQDNSDLLSPDMEVTPSPTYRIYGTNEPYSGMVVEVAGFLYTTLGGALEGVPYGQQVVAVGESPNDELQNTPLAGQNIVVPEGSDNQDISSADRLSTSPQRQGGMGGASIIGGY